MTEDYSISMLPYEKLHADERIVHNRTVGEPLSGMKFSDVDLV